MSGRNKYIYKITYNKEIASNLVRISKSIDYASIFISNKDNYSNLPPQYIKYDIIAGIDKLEVLKPNNNSFNALKKFHKKYTDWMFGYLSYDLKNEIENLQTTKHDEINSRKLYFFIPKYVLLLKGTSLTVLTFVSKKKTDLFIQSILKDNKAEIENFNINLYQRESKKDYINKIHAIKERIQMGDIYEMNYCLNFYCNNISINSQELFLKLNRNTKTPFASFFRLNECNIICASPERFIKKNKNTIISQPIKGTIRRGDDIVEDKKLINILQNSEKDITENIMIVDLVRNDLSKYAIAASVYVEELCKVYTFDKIHQMISTISAKIPDKVHFTEILKSTFPMGSMTGAPKLSAMQLIDKFEESQRGIFSGSLGYITPSGDFDFNVVIRTILYNSETKYISSSVGGAITANSEPEKEYEECLVKINPILNSLKNGSV